MTADLAQAILRRAYELDAENLDQQAQRLGVDSWLALTAWLEFAEIETEGYMLLTAVLPENRVLEIADGQGGLPSTAQMFWIAITLRDELEYSLHTDG